MPYTDVSMSNLRKHSRTRLEPSVETARFPFLLRFAFDLPVVGPLIVLIYARYSTDEQNQSSIADQVTYCKQFLHAWGLDDVEFLVLSDEATSGEWSSRPGIDAARRLVADRKCHLVISEDSSRLFRHPTACAEFFEIAFDADVRIICINDRVDTAEEDWPDRLHDAQRHHRQSNEYTRHRIIRSHDALWSMGASIGLLRPGYCRVATHAATTHDAERGPFFDSVETRWITTIIEAFLRIANGESPAAVAQYLTEAGLPKFGNSTKPEWTEGTVKALIKNPIYRGVEGRGKTVGLKQQRAGRRKRVPNVPEGVRQRTMPHYRIVEDWLWHAANEAIRKRDHGTHVSGRGNSQYGIPRDSRGPLSQRFRCQCGATMERSGASGYRCAMASPRQQKCWNKATAKAHLVHRAVALAIAERIERVEAGLDSLVATLTSLCTSCNDRHEERAKLESERDRLKSKEPRLRELATSSETPLEVVVGWLSEHQEKVNRVEAGLDRLKHEQAALRPLTIEDLRAQIEEVRQALTAMDRHSGPILQRNRPGNRVLPLPTGGRRQSGSSRSSPAEAPRADSRRRWPVLERTPGEQRAGMLTVDGTTYRFVRTVNRPQILAAGARTGGPGIRSHANRKEARDHQTGRVSGTRLRTDDAAARVG